MLYHEICGVLGRGASIGYILLAILINSITIYQFHDRFLTPYQCLHRSPLYGFQYYEYTIKPSIRLD